MFEKLNYFKKLEEKIHGCWTHSIALAESLISLKKKVKELEEKLDSFSNQIIQINPKKTKDLVMEIEKDKSFSGVKVAPPDPLGHIVRIGDTVWIGQVKFHVIDFAFDSASEINLYDIVRLKTYILINKRGPNW